MSEKYKDTILIAVGGNALIRDKEHQSVSDQYEAATENAQHIANVISAGYNVVMTHGNGPQVGYMLLRSELSKKYVHEVPLVSCVADSQGALGYHFQQTLSNALHERGIGRTVVTVVTQVIVERDDPSFQHPAKPIGVFYEREQAMQLQQERGWVMHEDAGRGWRRVVPSPRPLDVVELDAVRTLVNSGMVVIAAGGGGIPVIRLPSGGLQGVDAVIDKDRASALLAGRLGLHTMVISTSVDQVYLNFGGPNQKGLDRMSTKEAARYMAQGQFAEGSMLPKIEASLEFIAHGGKRVVITSPPLIEQALAGKAGTTIYEDTGA